MDTDVHNIMHYFYVHFFFNVDSMPNVEPNMGFELTTLRYDLSLTS